MISTNDVTLSHADLPKELFGPQSICLLTYYPFNDSMFAILQRFCADRPLTGNQKQTRTVYLSVSMASLMECEYSGYCQSALFSSETTSSDSFFIITIVQYGNYCGR
jgi:hypothetical protein